MIRYVMLVSPVDERIKNAQKIKERIPSLELLYTDSLPCDLFDFHLDNLVTDKEQYDGVIMMQDDIILSNDFQRHIERVMRQHKCDIVQFFERALAKNPLIGGWQNGAGFCSTVCYYMPASFTKVISGNGYRSEFRRWFAKRNQPWGYPIDVYISYVLGKSGMVYWRQLPYIVQHDSMPSTFKGRSTKRQSKYFIDDIKKEG